MTMIYSNPQRESEPGSVPDDTSGHAQRRHEVEGCSLCDKYKGQTHPSHDASPNCENGKREHCACDTCF